MLNTNRSLIILSIMALTMACDEPNEETQITDIDGNIYTSVTIGEQEWMVENLKVTHYQNGDAILNLNSDEDWAGAISGAYCAYDRDENLSSIYGYLYNWLAVNDDRNLAPAGWHIPTDTEWKELEVFLGMTWEEVDIAGTRGSDEGDKLKSTGMVWPISNYSEPNNESGFSALPGGMREGQVNSTYFAGINEVTYFWTSTLENDDKAWCRALGSRGLIGRHRTFIERGHSLRCIKD
jgi:uncharacterized protein (TIGR02145 family)